MTPVKLNEFNSAVPDVCINCDKEKGSIFHCLWQCSQIQKFWGEVKECMEEILGIQLLLEAKLFLLAFYPPNCNVRKKHGLFLDIL